MPQTNDRNWMSREPEIMSRVSPLMESHKTRGELVRECHSISASSFMSLYYIAIYADLTQMSVPFPAITRILNQGGFKQKEKKGHESG